jgi:hypothetical protein
MVSLRRLKELFGPITKKQPVGGMSRHQTTHQLLRINADSRKILADAVAGI